MDVSTTQPAMQLYSDNIALLQSIASLELEEGYLIPDRLGSPEVLAENRFIAARDVI